MTDDSTTTRRIKMFKKTIAVFIAVMMIASYAYALSQSVKADSLGRAAVRTAAIDAVTLGATTSSTSSGVSVSELDKVSFYVTYDETQHLGGIGAAHIHTAGTGYALHDILTVAGGTGGTYEITAVTEGVPTEITRTAMGSGYSIADDIATSVDPAGGSDCTIDVTYVGLALSAAFTIEVSYDNSTWLAASFYDYAGGATAQTSETISADGSYYCWFNPGLNVPYVRVIMTGTNTTADDTILTSVYVCGKP